MDSIGRNLHFLHDEVIDMVSSEHLVGAMLENTRRPVPTNGSSSTGKAAEYLRAGRHLMIVPSLACQATCAYCFGPNRGPMMRHEVLEATVDWIDRITPPDDKVEITFHGGEPLLPGLKWYQRTVPILKARFGGRLRLALQSNLWLLDDAYCAFFRAHGVSLGTSLDGPEPINDAQRGSGYFRRTMDAVKRARSNGLDVGCICTITARSAPHIDEIFDFFVQERLNVSFHVADPAAENPGAVPLGLSAAEHAAVMARLVDRYVDNLDKIRVRSLDSLIQGVSANGGGTCTYGDCLGRYLAVGPNGGIYPCQRFAGMPRYQFGNVLDRPTLETLIGHPVWRRFQDRQDRIEEECGGCPELDHCRGGCPYNVLAANGGTFDRTLRDPHCPAYKRIFGHIVDRATEEVFSEENLVAVVEQPDRHGMLRRGKLLSIMRDGPHPYDVAQRSKVSLR